jgi:hypothetical protein
MQSREIQNGKYSGNAAPFYQGSFISGFFIAFFILTHGNIYFDLYSQSMTIHGLYTG